MEYTIAADNYFNSYDLAKYLLKPQTLLHRTIQQNQGVPVELKMKKVKHNSNFTNVETSCLYDFVIKKYMV